MPLTRRMPLRVRVAHGRMARRWRGAPAGSSGCEVLGNRAEAGQNAHLPHGAGGGVNGGRESRRVRPAWGQMRGLIWTDQRISRMRWHEVADATPPYSASATLH